MTVSDILSLPLQVPAPGEYTLRVWLEDAAGNHDAERASDPISLRFDDEAPTAVFERSRRGDPLVGRGVGRRPRGRCRGRVDRGAPCRRAGVAGPGEPGSRATGWSATLDDAALAGRRLRAACASCATAPATSAPATGGGTARRCACRFLREPRRESCCARRRCKRRRGGGRAACRGRGRSAATGHRPRRAACGRSSACRARGSPWRPSRAAAAASRRVRDGRHGRRRPVLVRAPAAGHRAPCDSDYGGTRVIRPAAAEVRILVPRPLLDRGRPPLRAQRPGGHASAGGWRGGPIPDGGKLIDLQAFYRGRWRTFATPRTDARGPLVLRLPLRGHHGRGHVPLPGPHPARGGLSVRARPLPGRARDGPRLRSARPGCRLGAPRRWYPWPRPLSAMMSPVTTKQRLRELASLRPEGHKVLSVYLNLDPSEFPTQRDRKIEVESLLDVVERALRDDGLPASAEGRAEAGRGADPRVVRPRVRRQRRARGGGVRLLRRRTCSRSHRLGRPVRSEVTIDDSPFIEPLAGMPGDDGYGVLLINRRSPGSSPAAPAGCAR